MKKILNTICLLAVAVVQVNAVVVQHVTLHNGTELNGYMESQDGSGSILFHADNALVVVSGDKVRGITKEKQYSIANLDPAWVEWAEANDAFVGEGSERTLTLSNVELAHAMANNVYVLQRGATVKYVQMTAQTYNVAWKDIHSIRCDRRAKNSLVGVNCMYRLANGECYEGEVVEETDSTYCVYTDNKYVQSFKKNDVVKRVYTPWNSQLSVFVQSQLLDIVCTKDSEVSGIIVEYNEQSNNDAENYLLVKKKDGSIESVKLSEVESIKKKPNDNFTPLYDVLLNVGDVVINRREAVFVNVSENNDGIVLDSLNTTHTFYLEKTANHVDVVVEHHNKYGENIETFKMVKVSTTMTKTQKKEQPETVYSFNYRDLAKSAIKPITLDTSINKTTKAVYRLTTKGVYVLYDDQNQRVIPIIVKNK